MSGARAERELRLWKRQRWVGFIQGWLWLQQDGGEGCLRQVEQDAQAVQLCHGCSRSSPWSPALCCCWLKRKVLRRSLCCSQHPARVPGAVGQQQCPALPCKAALRHCYKYCGNQTSSYGWEQEEKPFFLKVLLWASGAVWGRGSGAFQTEKGRGETSCSSHGQPRAVVTSASFITLCLCGYEKLLRYKNREQEMEQLTSEKDKSLWLLISEENMMGFSGYTL